MPPFNTDPHDMVTPQPQNQRDQTIQHCYNFKPQSLLPLLTFDCAYEFHEQENTVVLNTNLHRLPTLAEKHPDLWKPKDIHLQKKVQAQMCICFRH